MIKNDSHLSGVIKSMGIVFGDIGTSPIYTLTIKRNDFSGQNHEEN